MKERRKSVWTPRRVVAAIALVFIFAFIAMWTSMPARAGGGAAIQSTTVVAPPVHSIAVRKGIVYPLELPPVTETSGLMPHSRRSHVTDPVTYRERKNATATGSTFEDLSSVGVLPLTTTPTFANNFLGLAAPDSQCTPNFCEPPDTQLAAGPNHIVEVVNVVGRIFDKTERASRHSTLTPSSALTLPYFPAIRESNTTPFPIDGSSRF